MTSIMGCSFLRGSRKTEIACKEVRTNLLTRTLVYYNTFAMSRDPDVYRDPEKFNPDRYIPKEEGGNGEPLLLGPFGFGRR